MLNLILFGPPGAGKGTQSTKLIEKFGLTHLSTGEILRNEITEKTPIGIEASKYIDHGILVPDDTVIALITARLVQNGNINGYVFDGFPRNISQAIALDKLLARFDHSLTLLVALEVEYSELISRLLLRSKNEGRTDDASAVVEKRLKLYREVTEPVMCYYKNKNKFISVDGLGEQDEIFAKIVAAIEKYRL